VPDELEEKFVVEENIIDGVDQGTGKPVQFKDPSRRLSTYLKTLGIEGDSATFIEKAREARLAAPKAFPVEYRAHTVNEYIREGFEAIE
jgi:hypothetical protein